ncbi:MAG: MltA domain-containing protein [Pseudomonadota bacterium]
MAGISQNTFAGAVRLLVFAVMAVALIAVIYIAVKRTAVSFEDDYVFAGAALQPMSYDDLDGWRQDDASASLAAFLLSCATLEGRRNDEAFNPHEGPEVLAFQGSKQGGSDPTDRAPDVGYSGLVSDWRPICLDAQRLIDRAYADRSVLSSVARQFFEANFIPIRIKRVYSPLAAGRAQGREPILQADGKATGYFEPVYDARSRPTEEFSAPLFRRPSDLVSVDLGLFDESLAGRRLAGRLSDGRLSPYPSRADINAGALQGRAAPIAYLRPNDLFFLQIQGSGRLTLDGMREVRVGYDGQNGRSYYAIGRSLITRGVLKKEDVTMQAIRLWLEEVDPADAQALREENASYVFFRILNDLPNPNLGPLGAQGVQLTSGRSVAVDRAYHPLGAPIWIETKEVQRAGVADRPSGALYVAQDVGGAIKGPIRADIFVGSGIAAGLEAGRMNEPVELTVLLPKAVAERLQAAGPVS